MEEDKEYGYIYCFSNEYMPDIYKIGMTLREPKERLKEANISNTWIPFMSYNLVIAKKVAEPLKKEKLIHSILEDHGLRLTKNREFFKSDIRTINNYFELIDGELYDINEIENETIKKSNNKLLDNNFSFSSIIYCKINDNIINKKSYNNILFEIYKLLNKEIIINNTLMNIYNSKIINKGFKYLENHDISIQSKDSNNTLKEIINQCENNNIFINLIIKLKDEQIIEFNL